MSATFYLDPLNHEIYDYITDGCLEFDDSLIDETKSFGVKVVYQPQRPLMLRDDNLGIFIRFKETENSACANYKSSFNSGCQGAIISATNKEVILRSTKDHPEPTVLCISRPRDFFDPWPLVWWRENIPVDRIFWNIAVWYMNQFYCVITGGGKGVMVAVYNRRKEKYLGPVITFLTQMEFQHLHEDFKFELTKFDEAAKNLANGKVWARKYQEEVETYGGKTRQVTRYEAMTDKDDNVLMKPAERELVPVHELLLRHLNKRRAHCVQFFPKRLDPYPQLRRANGKFNVPPIFHPLFLHKDSNGQPIPVEVVGPETLPRPDSAATDTDAYNTWLGYYVPYEKAKEVVADTKANNPEEHRRCLAVLSRWLRHELMVCDNNPQHAYYLRAWVANLLRNPDLRSDVIINISGPQGVGKTFFWDVIMLIIGSQHSIMMQTSKLLGSEFNSQFSSKILVVLDEFELSKFKTQELNLLKAWATSTHVPVREMYKDVYSVRNFDNIITLSNSEASMPLDRDGRREFFIACNNFWEHVKTMLVDEEGMTKADVEAMTLEELRKTYMGLDQWADSLKLPNPSDDDLKGLQRALYYVAYFYYSWPHHFDKKKVPQTLHTARVKLHHCHSVHSWWKSCLQRGYHIDNDKWFPSISTPDSLFAQYKSDSDKALHRSDRRRAGDFTDEPIFWNKLHEVCKDIPPNKSIAKYKKGLCTIRLHDLDTCRKEFMRYYNIPLDKDYTDELFDDGVVPTADDFGQDNIDIGPHVPNPRIFDNYHGLDKPAHQDQAQRDKAAAEMQEKLKRLEAMVNQMSQSQQHSQPPFSPTDARFSDDEDDEDTQHSQKSQYSQERQLQSLLTKPSPIKKKQKQTPDCDERERLLQIRDFALAEEKKHSKHNFSPNHKDSEADVDFFATIPYVPGGDLVDDPMDEGIDSPFNDHSQVLF